jgi:hypothetical protein
MGLDVWVIDWLELVFASQDNRAIPETTIVAAFLNVMSHCDIFEFLLKTAGLKLAKRPKANALELKNIFKNIKHNVTPCIDIKLVEKIMISLEGMTCNHWPDQMYFLAELEVNDSDVVLVTK